MWPLPSKTAKKNDGEPVAYVLVQDDVEESPLPPDVTMVPAAGWNDPVVE